MWQNLSNRRPRSIEASSQSTPRENWSAFWTFSEDEQRELLGEDLGVGDCGAVVELDEQSMLYFYNRRFAPLTIRQFERPHHGELISIFQVLVASVDDASLNMQWRVRDMTMLPHEAREKIAEWLKRTNYFLNLAGFENFCHILGKFEVSYN